MKNINKKNKSAKIFYLIVFSLLGFSCINKEKSNSVRNTLFFDFLKNSNESTSNSSSKLDLGNMDLANTDALYMNKGKIFKATQENQVREVELKDLEGKATTIQLPNIRRMIQLSQSYIMINFESSPAFNFLNINFNYMSYIVNINTGEVYQYESLYGIGDPDLGSELQTIQNDKFGNIYFITQVTRNKENLVRNSVVSLNIENLPTIDLKTVTPLNHTVYFFSSDQNGNLFYHAEEDKTNADINMYLSKDSINPTKVNVQNIRDIWRGLDEQIYYCKQKSIYKLNPDNNSELYGSFKEDFCIGKRNGFDIQNLIFNDKIIRIPTQTDNKIRILFSSKKPHIFEVYNEQTNQPKLVHLGKDFEKFSDYYYLGASTNYYYLQIKQKSTNKDFVLKVDPRDDSSIKIIDKYIVYKFAVDSDDNITFEGLQKSDMATTVLAKIPSGQTDDNINILINNIEKGAITILKPIN